MFIKNRFMYSFPLCLKFLGVFSRLISILSCLCSKLVKVFRGCNFKEFLRNKLRFSWDWAEVLSMYHIVQILNWAAYYVHAMHRGARLRSTSGDRTSTVKYTYTEWLKITLPALDQCSLFWFLGCFSLISGHSCLVQLWSWLLDSVLSLEDIKFSNICHRR